MTSGDNYGDGERGSKTVLLEEKELANSKEAIHIGGCGRGREGKQGRVRRKKMENLIKDTYDCFL